MKSFFHVLSMTSLLALVVAETSTKTDSMILNLCEEDILCRDIMYGNTSFPSCADAGDGPCITSEGKTLVTGNSNYDHLEKRAVLWWELMLAGAAAASDALDKWNTFADECIDAQGENGAYSDRKCAISAVSAVLMSGVAITSFITGGVLLFTRDEEHSSYVIGESGPFCLMTQNHTSLYKRDG